MNTIFKLSLHQNSVFLLYFGHFANNPLDCMIFVFYSNESKIRQAYSELFVIYTSLICFLPMFSSDFICSVFYPFIVSTMALETFHGTKGNISEMV